MTENRQAIIALGSNLGNRRQHLTEALSHLKAKPGIGAVVPSPTYETAPVGVEDQPPFLNMVAGVETCLPPEELMRLLLQIEREMGRIRTVRWGPRTIDLDLLFFEREERTGTDLTLPHPRWAERSFVTIPLKDLLRHAAFAGSTWEPLRRKLRDTPPDPDVKQVG